MDQSSTPLLSAETVQACTSGDIHRLKELIDSGSVLDKEAYLAWYQLFKKNFHVPDCKETAILRQLIRIAAAHKHEKIVHWLSCYTRPNADRVGQAIELGSIEALQFFIELDPNIPRRMRNKYATYLHVGLELPEWKAMQAIEILLKHGADPNHSAGSFLYSAIRTGNPRIVGLVEAYGGKPDKTEFIAAAADTGSIELVQYLLRSHADVNYAQEPSSGYTALHLAALNGDLNMIAFLLENGADPRRTSTEGKLAMDFATEITNTTTRDKAIELLSVNMTS